MGGISPWQILIVLLVVLILFGSKKLPDAARGVGRSMRIFKSEMKELNSDDEQQDATQQHQQQGQLPAGGQQQNAADYGVPPQQYQQPQPGQPQYQQPQQPYQQPPQQPGNYQQGSNPQGS